MIRTQVQLTEEQVHSLREIAASEGVSMSEVVRRAIEDTVRARHLPSRAELRRRALAVVGRFRSGLPDVAVEHDRELAEAFADP
jgi:metal-responsive CopG/Arc/MetJ family transcriptional regulator